MYRADQPPSESFKYKKLAVLVLIGITAGLLFISFGLLSYSLCMGEISWYPLKFLGNPSMIVALVVLWALVERLIPAILLVVEAFFVYRQHYIGCTIFMVLNVILLLLSILTVFGTDRTWFNWIFALLVGSLVAAMMLYWLELNRMRNEARFAAGTSSVYGQPIEVVTPSKSTTTGTRSTSNVSGTEAGATSS